MISRMKRTFKVLDGDVTPGIKEADSMSPMEGLAWRSRCTPPETYPGFFMADLKGSWKGTRTIRLDIFNPAKRPLPVTFRIDDVINPPYEDRINERILLKNGMNYVVLDFSRLTTSGTGRHLDTAHVCAFMFFIASPSRPVTIFIDNIRLCK